MEEKSQNHKKCLSESSNKLRFLTCVGFQHPVDSENISPGPGGRGYGAWARGSSGGSGAVGAGAGPSASAVASSATDADNRPANR